MQRAGGTEAEIARQGSALCGTQPRSHSRDKKTAPVLMDDVRTTDPARLWQSPLLPPVRTTKQLTAKYAEAQSAARRFPSFTIPLSLPSRSTGPLETVGPYSILVGSQLKQAYPRASQGHEETPFWVKKGADSNT